MEWRTITSLGLAAVLTTGCGCTAIANHQRQWLCHEPSVTIDSPETIAGSLSPTIDKPVNCFANLTGIVTTTFKRRGIRGWRDLGYDGEVTGVVAQTPVKSTDQFLTVDMKVKVLKIGTRDFSPDAAGKYLRAEVCLREVKLKKSEWPAYGDRVRVDGRMVWDCDGFVEIHPRTRNDVQIIR